MLSNIKSCAISGIEGSLIEVETDISKGIPAFDIVGLAGTAVKEAKERVRAAIRNTGREFPVKRVTINLAPAYVRKEGTEFDLPIAIGILTAFQQIDSIKARGCMFLGELALDGEIRPVRGALSAAVCALENNISTLVLPTENCIEASIIEGIQIIPVANLREVIDFLNGLSEKVAVKTNFNDIKNDFAIEQSNDFSDIKGQYVAKRALEVAASGAHNIIMTGSPGCGKTMLAKRLPTILPSLSFDEAMEVTKIYSVAGLLNKNQRIMTQRPFRNPHHTITIPGLIGGGAIPKPGEVSLAHYGVLFLDEMPEFSKNALEVLRQPLEDGYATISRLNSTVKFPSKNMLVAACNPCICGNYFDEKRECSCTPLQIKNYQGRISGPLLSRLDIQIDVPSIDYTDIESNELGESSYEIKQRVERVREIQKGRYKGYNILTNSELSAAYIKKFCELESEARKLLKSSFERLGLSARTYDRIMKVSRTIADMADSNLIRVEHIAEAIQYRSLDRRGG